MSVKRVFLFLLLTNILFSQELENIMSDLNQYSDKTHLNIDYKPTAMTVLYSSDLEALGINTLGEALDFVAGIQTFAGTASSSYISVRGQSQALNSIYEKIGFFINGVSVGVNYFENFPISLIDRVEISKGSTFGLNNPHSFVASINIITKNSNSFSVGTGSFDKKATSFIFNKRINKLDLGLDFFYLKDDKKVDAPSATLSTEAFGTSFDRKKESLEGKENINFGLSLKNDNFEFSNRYIKNKKQNNYGFFNYLDFRDDGYIEYETLLSELKYTNDLSQNNKFEAKIGVLQNNYKFETYFYKLEPNTLGFYNPHFKADYAQRDKYLSFLVQNRTFDKHEIDYGVNISKSSIVKNDFYTNVDVLYKVGTLYNGAYVPNSPNLTKFSGKDGNISDANSKVNSSYYIDDTYFYNNDLSFNFLLKVDDFETHKNAYNFKLGTTYSNNNIDIYKFILSKSSKTPSVLESSTTGHFQLYGNSNLKNEDVQSAEFIYIHTDNIDKLKLNLFYSIYKNSIESREFEPNKYEYVNKKDDEKNYGFELEYQRVFENRSKLFFNSSYNIYEYKNSYYNLDINTPIVSKIKANLGYIYPINSSLTISPLLRYYGDKKLLNGDSIDAVLLADLTLMYNFSKSGKLFFGAKNILDKDYYFYGHKTKDEKMLREGRTWFASFKYDF